MTSIFNRVDTIIYHYLANKVGPPYHSYLDALYPEYHHVSRSVLVTRVQHAYVLLYSDQSLSPVDDLVLHCNTTEITVRNADDVFKFNFKIPDNKLQSCVWKY